MSNDNSYILYVVDTETTGLDPDKNEIIELSLLRLNLNSGQEDQKTWLIRAMNPETVEDEALKISGHLREDVLGLSKNGKENYKIPKEVLPQIENWILEDDVMTADRVLAGHNVKFDHDMMTSLWNRNSALETFPFTVGHNRLLIDTKQIALFIDILTGRKRKYYNLGKIVKSYKVHKETAHRADADVRMCKDVLLRQIKPFIKIAIESFADTFLSEDEK